VQEESFAVLMFDVAGQRHGLPASDVQELLRAVAIAPLPHAPAGVQGVINLRGQVVPVVPLRDRVGLPARPLTVSDHLVVVRSAGRLLALRIDRALDLVHLAPADFEQAEGLGGWMARLPDGLVPVHELQSLLPPAKGGPP
jgi:purine-binding chemotaxis protein CheW